MGAASILSGAIELFFRALKFRNSYHCPEDRRGWRATSVNGKFEPECVRCDTAEGWAEVIIMPAYCIQNVIQTHVIRGAVTVRYV